MSMSKIKTIVKENTYITLAIDSYEEREPRGRIYHESSKGTMEFHSLIQMILIMEHIFSQINYPMKSMDQRQFHIMEEFAQNQEPVYQVVTGESKDEVKGNLGTVRLRVTGRYYATWQGEMTWMEHGEYHIFESFLEFIRIIDQKLGETSTIQMDLNTRQMFKVAVDDDKQDIGGRLYQPPKIRQYEFRNIVELMRLMDHSVEKLKNDWKEGLITASSIKPEQVLEVQRVQGQKGTFIIRILFEENATWQGTVIFKMTGEQVCFRSFLELVMLMNNAMKGRNMGKDVSAYKDMVSGI